MIEIKIIAEFGVKEGQAEAFKSMLASALVETRSFEGCKSVDIFEDQENSVFYALSNWSSHSDYDKYLTWRTEQGIGDLLSPMLEGGFPEGLVVRKVEKVDI
tara:strand:- start:93 stop:398 length:306 start_codon:yes stop_codon:yes gene_type:complete